MSSGWGNDPGAPGSGTGQPSDQGPAQPGYRGPAQPGYQGPVQPGYGAPQPPTTPPSPGYEQPPQSGYLAAPPRRRPAWLGPVVIGVIVVLVVGGFFLLRDRLSNEVTSLEVGQCFDTPAEASEVSDVQRQPCNEPHDAEVVASLTHPAPAGEAYPVVSGFQDYIEQNCVPAFNSYTGRNFPDAELGLSFFRPTLNGWANGDRGFTCFVVREDGQKLTATVRTAGTSP